MHLCEEGGEFCGIGDTDRHVDKGAKVEVGGRVGGVGTERNGGREGSGGESMEEFGGLVFWSWV